MLTGLTDLNLRAEKDSVNLSSWFFSSHPGQKGQSKINASPELVKRIFRDKWPFEQILL